MFDKNPFSEYRATQQQVQERTSAECNGMVCKNCGDEYGNPTEGSCMYDSKNPNGKNWMEAKATNEATLYVIPEDIPQQERTAFHGAAAAAAKAGKSHFNFAGKKHPVTMKKDTANAIADQKEGYYKDMEIKKQDKEMGAKPVPSKKKKEAKNGGKEGDIEMNPKMDTAKKEGVSKIRESLMAVLSEKEDRKQHTPNEDKAEKMKDNRKGKGAEDMMADADAEIAKGPDAHLNEPEIDKDNFKKMTKNVAKVHNLFPQKGIIKVGSDADLFVMDREVALLNKNHSKCDYNLYEKLQSYGEILSTLSRGKFVIKDNDFIGGTGKYIK